MGKHPFQGEKYVYNIRRKYEYCFCRRVCKKHYKRIHRFAVARQYFLDELDIVDLVRTTREVKLMRHILLKDHHRKWIDFMAEYRIDWGSYEKVTMEQYWHDEIPHPDVGRGYKLMSSGDYDINELLEDAKTDDLSRTIVEKIIGTTDEDGNLWGGDFIARNREPAPTLMPGRRPSVASSSYSDHSDEDDYQIVKPPVKRKSQSVY